MKTRVVNRRRERFDVYIGRPGPFGNPFRAELHRPLDVLPFRTFARLRLGFALEPLDAP